MLKANTSRLLFTICSSTYCIVFSCVIKVSVNLQYNNNSFFSFPLMHPLPQDLALTEEALPIYTRCAIHALSAAYLNLISQLTTVPTFCQHVHEVIYLSIRPPMSVCLFEGVTVKGFCFLQVIESRKKLVPFLLPEDVLVESSK